MGSRFDLLGSFTVSHNKRDVRLALLPANSQLTPSPATDGAKQAERAGTQEAVSGKVAAVSDAMNRPSQRRVQRFPRADPREAVAHEDGALAGKDEAAEELSMRRWTS